MYTYTIFLSSKRETEKNTSMNNTKIANYIKSPNTVYMSSKFPV